MIFAGGVPQPRRHLQSAIPVLSYLQPRDVDQRVSTPTSMMGI
jgi:hypothetical protein